nr:hypothetical protein CFP56_21883 [Quercus suber]
MASRGAQDMPRKEVRVDMSKKQRTSFRSEAMDGGAGVDAGLSIIALSFSSSSAAVVAGVGKSLAGRRLPLRLAGKLDEDRGVGRGLAVGGAVFLDDSGWAPLGRG